MLSLRAVALPRVRLVAALAVVASTAACTTQPTPTPPSAPAATAPQAPRSELPSPDQPTPAPAGGVVVADLPEPADLWAPSGAAWVAGETMAGSPRLPISACQRSKWESTGPGAAQVRTFTGPSGATAGAVVLSYPDAATAEQAVSTINEWIAACGELIASNGGTEVRSALPPTPVKLDGGQGQISEIGWKTNGSVRSESQGIVRLGDRVAFVALQMGARTDGGDIAEHPMARTLPAVARRLAP